MYSDIIYRIAKDHNVIVYQNPADCNWQLGNEISLGVFDNDEYKLLAFFHEMGHFLDKSAGHSNKFEEEKAAWAVGYKLAHKYSITFSEDAIKWGLKQLETYKKDM